MKLLKRYPFLVYLSTSIWLGLILYGCLKPASTFKAIQIPIPYIDKAVHFLMFFGWAFLLLMSFTIGREKMSLKSLRIGVLSSSFILGLGIECLQTLPIINRSFEWADLLCDMFGAITALYFYRIYIYTK